MLRKHVFIKGRVIGIFFRKFIVDNANNLGLKGWVKNSGSGVECAFEGEPGKVEKMIELCWKGPSGAGVDSVDAKDEPFQNEKEFRRLD